MLATMALLEKRLLLVPWMQARLLLLWVQARLLLPWVQRLMWVRLSAWLLLDFAFDLV